MRPADLLCCQFALVDVGRLFCVDTIIKPRLVSRHGRCVVIDDIKPRGTTRRKAQPVRP